MFFRKFGNLHKVERSYQKCFGQRLLSGLGICSSVFWANCSFFAKKWANERLAKTTRDLLIPSIFGWSFLVSDLSELLMVAHCWWATWAIRSHHSFLVSDLSNLLTSLIKKERMRKLLVKKSYKNVQKYTVLVKFCWANSLFFVSKRANERFAQKKQANRSIAHLSWATWAFCSWSPFWHERPERFAHSCSFDLSDLSKWMSDDRMSEFPTLLFGPNEI